MLIKIVLFSLKIHIIFMCYYLLRLINRHIVAKPKTQQMIFFIKKQVLEYYKTTVLLLWCVARKDVHMFSAWVINTILILSVPCDFKKNLADGYQLFYYFFCVYFYRPCKSILYVLVFLL